MNESPPPRLYRRREDVVTRSVGQESILVPLSNGRGDLEHLFRLNPVGALVWECLAEASSPAGLCQAVEESFDVSAEAAARDVQAFLDELVAAELVEAVPNEAPGR